MRFEMLHLLESVLLSVENCQPERDISSNLALAVSQQGCAAPGKAPATGASAATSHLITKRAWFIAEQQNSRGA